MTEKLPWAASAAQVLLGLGLMISPEFRQGFLQLQILQVVTVCVIFGTAGMTFEHMKQVLRS